MYKKFALSALVLTLTANCTGDTDPSDSVPSDTDGGASVDGSSDVAAVDASELSPDAAIDAATGTLLDAGSDSAVDSGIDETPDAAPDAASDALADSAPDSAGDALADSSDAGDAGPCNVKVGYMPAYRPASNAAVDVLQELENNWSDYGDCTIVVEDVYPGWTLESLTAAEYNVLGFGYSMFTAVHVYTEAEIQALTSYIENGNAGLYASFSLRYTNNAALTTALCPLLGLDCSLLDVGSTPASYGINIIRANHPLMAGLPSPFRAVEHPHAQSLLDGSSWADVLAGAEWPRPATATRPSWPLRQTHTAAFTTADTWISTMRPPIQLSSCTTPWFGQRATELRSPLPAASTST